MNKLKLIAVARVKNEIDIIEAFVRHNSQHFDRIIAADDGSTDGTYEALLDLQSQGLPLIVLRDFSTNYNQRYFVTKLVRIALERFGADWIAPLDADEFLEPPMGVTLSEMLAATKPTLRILPWANFVWSDEHDGPGNPVERLVWRLPARFDFGKVIIPAAFIAGHEFEITQGSHGLIRNGSLQFGEPLDGVVICHFPIRSVRQYASKIATGYLQYAADFTRRPGEGFHYDEPFRALLKGLNVLKSRMEADSRFYSMEASAGQGAVPVRQPLRYLGGPTVERFSQPDVIANVLNHATHLAWMLNRVGATLGAEKVNLPDLKPNLPRYQNAVPDMNDPANVLASAFAIKRQNQILFGMLKTVLPPNEIPQDISRPAADDWWELELTMSALQQQLRECERLNREVETVTTELANVRGQYIEILNSTSWKIVKPVRVLVQAIKGVWRAVRTRFDRRGVA